MLRTTETLQTISEIHNWLDLCAEIYNRSHVTDKITVDLSQLKYVSPIGCTTLLSTLCFLDKFFYLDIIVPVVHRIEETNVVGYIERMNFFKYSPEIVRATFENELDMNYLYGRNRNNQENSLNEITLCKTDIDVEKFDSSLKRILRNKGVSQNRVSNISRIVTELGFNSIEHGKDGNETLCYYCIQSYRSGKMDIAICDSGIGIVKSLENHVNAENDDDVVRQAILTKASSLVDQDRGKGLPDVKNVALKLNDAKFYVRTHNSAYQIFDKKVKSMVRGKYFYGTYFYLVVNP